MLNPLSVYQLPPAHP
ncbi:hypothetical protein L195_g059202, partial [Trifolium pratense]